MSTYSPYPSTSVHTPTSPAFSPMELSKEAAYNSPVARYDLPQGGGSPPTTKQKHRKIPGSSAYRTMSGILGFKETPSLALYVFFGGALLGFCLFYCQMFSFATMKRMTIPGEWFWLGTKEFFHVNYSIHIYLSCIGGILSLLQFLPAIRRRYVLFHRINGCFVLLTLIPANICGAIAGNRAFGGEINAQSAYYTLGLLTVGCFLLGFFNARRDTRQHRKWMLRGVVIFSVGITTRLIVLAARQIVTDIGNYYSLFRCEELMSVINLDEVRARFPACVADGVDISATFVPVLANARSDALGFGSATRVTQGMALWFALITHILGVEAYLIATDEANYYKRDFALEPKYNEAHVDLGPYPMAIGA